MCTDAVWVIGVVVQATKHRPRFLWPALHNEPSGRLWDPEAPNEQDQWWHASKGYWTSPPEREIAGEETAETDPGGYVVSRDKEETVQASEHAAFRGSRCFRQVYGDQCSKGAEPSALDDAYNDQHGYMHTPSCEGSADNGDGRGYEKRPSPANLVCCRAAGESPYAGTEEEQGIDGPDDVVRVRCSRTSS